MFSGPLPAPWFGVQVSLGFLGRGRHQPLLTWGQGLPGVGGSVSICWEGSEASLLFLTEGYKLFEENACKYFSPQSMKLFSPQPWCVCVY